MNNIYEKLGKEMSENSDILSYPILNVDVVVNCTKIYKSVFVVRMSHGFFGGNHSDPFFGVPT